MPDWFDLKHGIECPFDLPRHRISEFMLLIDRLSISTLYLSREQTYEGACVLIFDPRHVVRIDELSGVEWRSFSEDLRRAQSSIFRVFNPDHINVASLGSVGPHLHWHITPRYRSDPRWGGPIWMTRESDMPVTRLADAEYRSLIDRIREDLHFAET